MTLKCCLLNFVHFVEPWFILNDCLCSKRNIPALGVNTMPADALAPKVDRAPAGMVLSVYDRQHVALLHPLWIQSSFVEDIPSYDTKCEFIFNNLENNSAC